MDGGEKIHTNTNILSNYFKDKIFKKGMLVKINPNIFLK